jgi:plasmid maintenance system antidote protein VapI
MDARGWTPAALATMTQLAPETISGIIAATTAITDDIAQRLGSAFGTSVQFWLNTEAIYRRDLARGATVSYGGTDGP